MSSSADGLQYPFHNIPSIVLNKKDGEATAQPMTAAAATPDVEAYTELSATVVLSPQTRNYISFLPKPASRELEVVDGDLQHPRRHLLSQNEFVSPTTQRIIREKSAISPQSNKQKQKQSRKNDPTPYSKITKYDEEAMKYYIAGLSVVGLLIFYRFITRTKY